ncbi:MAG: hypothetical protein E4G74_03915 [Erysipelotrichales bacterium]|nr:MAG: hypothetical protein E4G74_03915 [Erysipelotrichales bacterium]
MGKWGISQGQYKELRTIFVSFLFEMGNMSNGENEHNAWFQAYLGNSKYHQNAYRNYKISGKVPFNCAAFVVGGWWFLYHRLVWIAVTLLLFRIVLITLGLSWVRDAITLGIALYAGFRGNAMLYEKMDKTLERLEPFNSEQSLNMIASKEKPWKWVSLFFVADVILSLVLRFPIFK